MTSTRRNHLGCLKDQKTLTSTSLGNGMAPNGGTVPTRREENAKVSIINIIPKIARSLSPKVLRIRGRTRKAKARKGKVTTKTWMLWSPKR